MKDEPVLLYTTYPSLVEAEKSGLKIVGAGFAACVNIVPGMRSIYRWKGVVEAADEVVMFVKTRASLAERVTAVLRENHSYETPAILVIPLESVDADYLAWMTAETGDGRP